MPGEVTRHPMTLKRLLVLAACLAVLAMAFATPTAIAQEGGGGQGGDGAAGNQTVLEYVVEADDAGCEDSEYCFRWSSVPGENPVAYLPAGTTVIVHVENVGEQFHNFAVDDAAVTDCQPGAQSPDPCGTNLLGPGETATLQFTVADDAPDTVEYWCNPHRSAGMVGEFATVEAAFNEAFGGGGVAVHELGVHFLAYWVGIISFAALFIVYGATFFLFKYGESSATTDHKDRGDEPTGDAARRGRAIGIVLAIVVIAGVAALAAMQQGLIG